jgi:hypothetical protein
MMGHKATDKEGGVLSLKGNTDMVPQPSYALTREEGQAVWFLNALLIVKATGADTSIEQHNLSWVFVKNRFLGARSRRSRVPLLMSCLEGVFSETGRSSKAKESSPK